MHTFRKALLASTALALIATSEASAQRRPAATTATRAGSQPAQGSSGGPATKWTLYAGVATGDDFDLGLAVQGSYRVVPTGWPVAIRIDPYFAHHGSDGDVSLNIFGVAGHVEYTFPTQNSDVEPFILGGLGFYYSKLNLDDDFDDDLIDDSSTDLGISLGGGIRFAKRWVAEAQFKMIDEFDTIPLLIGFRF